MTKLSGNHAAWLATVAREIREAGKPASFDFLLRVVPSQFATARNDGHVTAAESGLSRDDYVAGWRLWIEGALAALFDADLITKNGDGWVWTAEQDGTWKVKFGRSSYALHGREEMALARDRGMLGSSTEPTIAKEPEASPGALLKGMAGVEVTIATGIDEVIKKGKHTLEVHPLAFVIPPMTPAEQEMLRKDIAEHGVRVPLTLYPDAKDKTVRGKPKLKILDGRHRSQFASALSKPVKVELFKGAEIEARQYVMSLNLARRHLTPAQRALTIVRLFGEPARSEAKKAQIEGAKQSPEVTASLPEPDQSKSRSGGWEDRAVEMAGGKAAGVSARSVRTMAAVVQAPETVAKIEAGTITSVNEAKKEAAIELGKPAPPPPWETTLRGALSRARLHLRNGLESLEGTVTIRPTSEWSELLDEIAELESAIRTKLDKRGLL